MLLFVIFQSVLSVQGQAGTGTINVNAAIGTDVAGCGATGSPCASISFAIAEALPNETIIVAPGTYIEYLLIDKPLTLLGPNTSIAGYSGTRGAEAIILPSDNSRLVAPPPPFGNAATGLITKG